MPTGYTCDIENGTIVTLNEYAWTCARAFGVLIDMRDKPHDAPIAIKVEPDLSYHHNCRKDAEERLRWLETLTPEQITEETAKTNASSLQSYTDRSAQHAIETARYQAMRAQVEAWKPPLEDLAGLKKFMLQQIDASIHPPSLAPEPSTPEVWFENEIKSAKWSLNYAIERAAKAIKSANEQTTWLLALAESVGSPPGAR